MPRARKAPEELAPSRISLHEEITRGIVERRICRVSIPMFTQPAFAGLDKHGQEKYHLLTSPKKYQSYDAAQVETFCLDNLESKPLGKVGRRYWLSERFYAPKALDQVKGVMLPRNTQILYAADMPEGAKPGPGLGRVRLSYNMPRWAARIYLQVTDIEVARIQSISPVRAMAEGAEYIPDEHEEDKHTQVLLNYAEQFDRLHGDGAWLKNPWVWGYQLSRIEL